MLAALVAYFLLGGGGATGPMLYLEVAVDNIDAAIVDGTRRDQARVTMNAMIDRTEDHHKTVAAMRKELSEVLADYGSDKDKIDQSWATYFELDDQYGKDIIDLRFGLRDQLSREEWQALFPIE